MHKSQVFLYLLSAFIAGVFANSFGLLNSAWLLVLIVSGVAIVAISYKSKFGLLAGFLLLAFVAGGARFNFFNNSSTGLDNLIGQEVSLIGYVDSEPEIDGTNQKLVFNME